jgi:hypothetical protein
MIVRDLFDLAATIVSQIDYMTDTYEEYDSSLDDIPDKTLDDIIDEINRENETPTNDDPEPSDDPEPEPEPSPDPEPEPEPEPEDESPMDTYINRANFVISEINAAKHNAEIAGVLDRDVTNTQKEVIRSCVKITYLLSLLYDILNGVVDVFNSDSNINKRSKFSIDSYAAISKFTILVNNIYKSLEERAYLAQVNGPIESDIEHWNAEEVQNHLVSLDAWLATDDDKKLSLIDEAIQFDLKYSALLKKLVISEFKGFDEYYNELIEFLCAMHKAVINYEPEDAAMGDPSSAFYDPSILGKVSAITMVTEGYIPFEPEPEPEPDP